MSIRSRIYISDRLHTENPLPPAHDDPKASRMTPRANDLIRNEYAPTSGGTAPVSVPKERASRKTSIAEIAVDSIRHPRRRIERHVLRPLRRRINRLSWTTRQTLHVALTMTSVLYLSISVPFRVGFLYDPIHSKHHSSWTTALTILTALDVLSDTIGVRDCLSYYRTWKDEFSMLSESVSFELGKKLAKKASHDHKAPKISMRNQLHDPGRRDSQATWTLATIAPSAAASSLPAKSERHQRTFKLALEIIAVIPIELIVLGTGQYNLLHVLRLTKLCRLWRILACVDLFGRIYSGRAWMQQLSLTGISTLVRNISLAAMCCHWFACGFMLIAHHDCGVTLDHCDHKVETSWVIKDRLLGASVARKYARALYWSSRTQVMLGFDDLTPISDIETLYGLLVQLVDVLISSSILATFLFIFRSRDSRQAAFSTHVDNSREYMKSQGVPRDVRRKVMSYYNYAWSTHHSLHSEAVLDSMPKHLQSKVVYTLKASRIKQVSFLMKESVEFINLLALALVRRVYIPGDSIIEPKINAKMFFVIRGTVVLSAFDGSKAKECQTGDFFADCCLLHPEKYEEKAVAKTFCELYVLTKAQLDEAIGQLYRGNEQATRERMVKTFESYATQLRKAKKLLGLRGAEDNSGEGLTADTAGDGGSRVVGSRSDAWKLPGSTFRGHWDLVRLIATIYCAFEVPYYIVFISNHESQTTFLVSTELGGRYFVTLLTELFFMADILLRARYFAYLDPVAMLSVVDSSMIFAAYRANGFVTDMIGTIPIALVMESAQGVLEDYSWAFRLLRLVRLRDLRYLMLDLADFFSVSSKIHLIISLLIGVTLMVHIVACVWFSMAWIPSHDSEESHREVLEGISRPDCLHMATVYQNCSWVRYDCYGHIGTVLPIDDAASPYKASFAYVRAGYFAIVALTGVGYGDIVAYSTAETFFAACWIFVGGIINLGIVGAMSSTIGNLMATQHHHVEKVNTLNNVMEHLGISEKLRGEIRRFYHHQFRNHKKAYESELLEHLPDQLCYQISSLLHSNSTKRVTLFDSASREFLEDVTGKFRHRTFQNGETLYIEGDTCKEFLVISHGKVNLYCHSRHVPIGALHDGDCYGVHTFLLKRAHPVTLIAASPIHASVMTREHFDEIQRKYADEMRDIRTEASEDWAIDMARYRSITRNLESKIKLKPHLLATPSLFYHKDLATATANASNWTETSGRASRDAEETRTKIQGAWNTILTFWNIYNAFSIIFRIAFYAHIHYSEVQFQTLVILDLIGDAHFVIDIYLRVFYFEIEEIALDNVWTRAVTNRAYLKSRRFRRDLVAALPLYYMSIHATLLTNVLRLPRLLRTVDLWGYIDEVIIQIQQLFSAKNVSSYLSPLKLFFFLILGTHYAGCIFFLFSEHECVVDPAHCWETHDIILHDHHHSLLVLYMRSFYWALTTLTLVGSREIAPRDMAGTMYSAFTCLGCTFIMSYIIGELSELILDMDKEEKEYKSRIESFEHFAKEHALPESLRGRVSLFFKIQFEHTQGKDLNETVHDLSANLRLKLMHEIYGTVITTLPIARFLSFAQVNNIALRLKSELFIPGDEILAEDSFGSRLCILRKGLAAVFWSESVTSVAVLLEGCLFGEVAFFLPKQRRIASVNATTSCEVLYISKHAWNELWTGSGDATDAHVHKYAQHSILEWVKGRMQCYQESSLTIAKRTNRNLIERRIMANLRSMMAPTKRTLKRDKTRMGRSFLTPEAFILEKKAKYLLNKAEKCMAKHTHIYNGEGVNMSMKSGNYDRVGHRRQSAVPGGQGHGHTLHNKKTFKIVDASFRQFFVEVNPVSKKLVEHLPDEHLRKLENESWRRFRYMMALQHAISDMMEVLVPRRTHHGAHHGPSPHPPTSAQSPNTPTSHSPKRRLSIVDGGRTRRRSLASQADDSKLLTKRPDPLPDLPKSSVTSESQHSDLKNHKWDRLRIATLGKTTTTKNVLRSLKRCHSLPVFDTKYFEQIRAAEEKTRRATYDAMHDTTLEMAVGSKRGITFDILQRCQRPKFTTLYRFYRKYTSWTSAGHGDKETDPSEHSGTFDHGHVHHESRRGSGQVSSIAMADDMSSQQRPRHERKSIEFQELINRLGRSWDLVILLIALYYAVSVPYKVAFAHTLESLSGLEAWAGIEYLMDALCAIDIGYRLRKFARLRFRQTHSSKHSNRLVDKWITRMPSVSLRTYDGFVLDAIALLPLEIFVMTLPQPLSALSYHEEWRYLCYFRLNRLVFTHRIKELSESLFQYIVYDLKWPIPEPMLYFGRSVIDYLLMGHWMACWWFAVSERAYQEYGISWLSYPGMLQYVRHTTSSSSSGSTHHRVLSAASGGHASSGSLEDLAHISMSRKYLRSMHFAMCSITTLFYGDIVSMNLVELIIEMIFIIWAIYIFGTLVGANGELLEVYSQRNASFEQTLSDLQHYLIQNDVPKVLKKQIKQYYASIWRRRHGEQEFEAIQDISRSLHEDAVYATLSRFAHNVPVFRSLDVHFLRALLVKLDYVVCSENEEIVLRGDVDRCMYFISEGRVLVKHEKSEKTKEQGDFFGELALLYGIPRGETCIALTGSELYRLDHEPYEELLLDFPEYRVVNKCKWTTAEPPQTVLSMFMHTRIGEIAADESSKSSMLDEQVPQSFIYRSTMELLSRLDHIDALQAKDIIENAKDGARKHLKQVMSIETARPDNHVHHQNAVQPFSVSESE